MHEPLLMYSFNEHMYTFYNLLMLPLSKGRMMRKAYDDHNGEKKEVSSYPYDSSHISGTPEYSKNKTAKNYVVTISLIYITLTYVMMLNF